MSYPALKAIKIHIILFDIKYIFHFRHGEYSICLRSCEGYYPPTQFEGVQSSIVTHVHKDFSSSPPLHHQLNKKQSPSHLYKIEKYFGKTQRN